MNIISYGRGEDQIAGASPLIGQFGAGAIVTFWHRGYEATRALLDRCAAVGARALVQCEDWSKNFAPTFGGVGAWINDHAAHPAFAGFYFDEPGIPKPAQGDPLTALARYRNLLDYMHARTSKPTVAVFGLFSELTAGWSGLARVEGVDNYWNDPEPASRDWAEYAGFVDALIAGHRRTGWAGEYVSVVAAYARPSAGWTASAAEMTRTHEYLRGQVGERLKWAMLWAADTGSGSTQGYMLHDGARREAVAFAASLNAPPPPPEIETVTVKLRAGQRLVVELA